MIKRSALRHVAAGATAILLAGKAVAGFVDLGGSTLDTTTGLEWLDLDRTRNLTFRDVVESPLYASWRHATTAEVQALLRAWDLPVTPLRTFGRDHTPNAEAVAAAFQAWQALFNERPSETSSYPLRAIVADTMDGRPDLHHVYFANLGSGATVHSAPLLSGIAFSEDAAIADPLDEGFGPLIGVGEDRRFRIIVLDHFLVRHTTVTPIPEPETYALMLAGFAALAAARARRRDSA